nr:transglycosylase SLT domain-containing protein [Parvularcula maris]
MKSTEGAAGQIKQAIRSAASQSGLDFDLLLGVAKRESSLQADAKAKTSSASGLFQFIDQTWLGAVKEHGEALGLGDYAKDITREGRKLVVADPARREEILNLRFKPDIAAKVAGKTLSAAKARVSQALGREANPSEVYMAHFLGERGAIRMLQAGEGAEAAAIDPKAAGANKSLFFDGARPLSVAEFKGKLALHIGVEEPRTPADVQVPLAPRGPVPTRHAAPPVTEIPYAPHAASTSTGQTLPPQIFAAIVDMQSELLFGKDES